MHTQTGKYTKHTIATNTQRNKQTQETKEDTKQDNENPDNKIRTHNDVVVVQMW